jgi:hypothetical protein
MRPIIQNSGAAGGALAANDGCEQLDGRDALAALAEQQAALRRVATLVARAASPAEVFSVVAEEMARCLKVANAEVHRYEDNGARIVCVGNYAEPGVPHVASVRATRSKVRMSRTRCGVQAAPPAWTATSAPRATLRQSCEI